MSQSYRLYQVGREPKVNLDDWFSVSSLTTFVTPTDSSSDAYHYARVDDLSPFNQSGGFFRIENEIVNISTTTKENFDIRIERGLFGTKITSHQSGTEIYSADASVDELLNDNVSIIDEVSSFRVHKLGEVEDKLEREKGQFRLKNMSATVSGIDRHRLREAGNIQKPWVFEVYINGTLEFQGIVQKDVKYNASTRKISLKVVSWLDLLNNPENIPARWIYEVEVISSQVQSAGEYGTEAHLKINNDDFGTENNEIQGSAVAIETGAGEIREMVLSDVVVDNNQNRKLYLNTERKTAEDILYDSRNDNDQVTEYLQTFTPENLVNATYRSLSVNTTEAKNVIEDIGDKSGFYLTVFDSADNVVETFEIDKSSVEDSVNNANVTNESWPSVFYANVEYGSKGPLLGGANAYYLITSTPKIQRVKNKFQEIDDDDKIRILGQSMWGYNGEPGETDGDGNVKIPDYYKVDTLISALFNVNDESAGQPVLGILPDLVPDLTGVSFSGTAFETIDPRVEFPSKPIEALRMIQQTSQTLLSENTSTQEVDGDLIPKVTFDLIERVGEGTATTSADRIVKWKETVSSDNLRAVVVETNEQYSGGGNRPTAVGWYYKGVKQDEIGNYSQLDYKPKFTTKPEGEDVIEIKTNIYPSHTGVRYTGGDEAIRRDERLSAAAEEFYEHFKTANREVEITLARDASNLDVIGKYVAFNEGPIVNDVVYVTGMTKTLKENYAETTLQGRIGQRAGTLPSDPRAIIDAPLSIEAESNDEATVRVSGLGSWDAAKGALSYSWEYKFVPDSKWQNGPNSAVFEHVVPSVTERKQFQVRLTVTNNKSGETAQETKTIALQPYTEEIDEVRSTEIQYEKDQFTENGTRYGRITLFPKIPPIVDSVEYDSVSGAELTAPFSYTTIDAEDANDSTSAFVTDQDGNTVGWQAWVPLDEKHVSNIQTRVNWRGESGQQPQTRIHTFDFDRVPGILSLGVFRDSDKNLKYNLSVDGDVEQVFAEYFIDGALASEETITNLSVFQSEYNTEELVLSGQTASVKITPQRIENGNVVSGDPVTQTVSFGTDADTDAEVSTLNAYINADNRIEFAVGTDDDTTRFSWEVTIDETLEASGEKQLSTAPSFTTKDTGVPINYGQKAIVSITPFNNQTPGPTVEDAVEVGVQESRDKFTVQKSQDDSVSPNVGIVDIIPDDFGQILNVYYRANSGGELVSVPKNVNNYNGSNGGEGAATVIDKDGLDTYRCTVDLAQKHNSTIEYYVEFVSAEDVVNVVTFDSDKTAEFRNVSAYVEPTQTSAEGYLKVNTEIDEDVSEYYITFGIGQSQYSADGNPFTSPLNGHTIQNDGSDVTITDGEQVSVSFSPKNANGETGVAETVRTFYNESGWIKQPNRLLNSVGSIDLAVGEFLSDASTVGIEANSGGGDGSTRVHLGTDGSKVEFLAEEIDNTNGDTFVSIGNGKDLTNIGISIFQQGNKVFKVDSGGTTEIGNLDVVNDLQITNGRIVNVDEDYEITSNGFAVIHGNANSNSYSFKDTNGTINGQIYMFDNGSENELNIETFNSSGMQIRSDEQLEIYQNGFNSELLISSFNNRVVLDSDQDQPIKIGFGKESVKFWDRFDTKGASIEFWGGRSTKVNSTDLDNNEFVIYAYTLGDDDPPNLNFASKSANGNFQRGAFSFFET